MSVCLLTAEACEELAGLEVMQTNVQTTQTREASALAKSMTSSWIIIVFLNDCMDKRGIVMIICTLGLSDGHPYS